MPRVKLDYVVSFSSEDSEHPANNLLAHEVSKKKWLCGAGEPSCSAVLQMSRAVQISTVHIGAYHAALVEVLVGRSEKPNDQFEVLVPSSVFLSPTDSRRGTGAERVRSFSGDQLSAARSGRWDRVRVVCSQPYNKHCKYGLSFIHIFEPEDRTQSEPASKLEVPKPAAPAVPRRMMAIDNFSSDEDEFKPGELFAKHQQRISEGAGTTDTGAQIRQATSQALKNISDSSTKLVKTPISKTSTNRLNQSNHIDTNRQKESLMYTDDDELPHSKIDAIVQRHKDDKEHESKKKEPPKKDQAKESKLANSSRNFRDFLDDNDDKRKDLNNSRNKESSRDDRRKDLDNSRSKDSSRDDRRKDLDNSRSKDSSRDDSRKDLDNSRSKDSSRDDRRKDLDNSRSKDSSRDDRRKDLNNSRSKESSTDGRRHKDDDRTPSRKKTDDSFQNRDTKKRPHPDEKQKSKDALRPGPVSAVPHTLLSHVVFALSGYENPRRARIRDAAVAMGARFERDWSPACTHLVCAFPNTPKLRSVRASQSSCIAVLGEWVENCCEHRRLLPWQWFATEPRHQVQAPTTWAEEDEASGHSTECDTDDEIEKVLRKQKRQRIDSSPSPQPQNADKSPKPHTSREKSPKPHSSRDKSPKAHTSKDKPPKYHTSGEATPKKKDSSQSFSNTSTSSDVVFMKDERIQGNITIDSDSDETDEEKPVHEEKVNKKSVLPDFFEGYTFVIDEKVEEAGFDVELLKRYVKAYGGVVVDASQVDSESEISFVLSARARAGAAAARGRRVRADWVWRCHERKTLCDAAEFAL